MTGFWNGVFLSGSTTRISGSFSHRKAWRTRVSIRDGFRNQIRSKLREVFGKNFSMTACPLQNNKSTAGWVKTLTCSGNGLHRFAMSRKWNGGRINQTGQSTKQKIAKDKSSEQMLAESRLIYSLPNDVLIFPGYLQYLPIAISFAALANNLPLFTQSFYCALYSSFCYI